ncbi:MAG: class I SAM-dependent methyltransferase, partial [Bacteroidetes bacterium]
STKEHWEQLFRSKAENEVGWFQPYPKTSVAFLDQFRLPLTANIIDVGAGDSHFIDVLLERGYQNIWVLDIAESAIARMQKRLGAAAERVHWVVSDITDFQPEVQFDFWHDRAAFHFLTSEKRIDKYVNLVERAVRQDGYLVLGTFSDEGPEKCSGLDIRQYSETTMSAQFEECFRRIKCFRDTHVTPFDSVQQFLFCSFQRMHWAEVVTVF